MRILVKPLIHLILLLWAASVFWLASQDALGADPVKAIIHFFGVGAVNLLLITLAISPIAKYFKLAIVMQQRRLIGLYSFAYACFHLLCYWWFELNFSIDMFVAELIKRPYIWLGMFAFSTLFILAVTSPNVCKKKLKQKWQSIHNFIYLAAIFAIWHFFLSRKADILEPALYVSVLLILLCFRHKKFTNWLKAFAKKR